MNMRVAPGAIRDLRRSFVAAGSVRRRSRPAADLAVPTPIGSASVRALLYDADAEDREVDVHEIDVDVLHERRLLWIDVGDPEHLEQAVEGLGLSDATMDKLRHPPTRPELEFGTSYFHVNVVVAERTPTGYLAASLQCVAGENWILTVHSTPIAFLERFDERVQGDSRLGHMDAGGLVVTFLHDHLASYVREIEPFELELDVLDLRVMAGKAADSAVFKNLVDLRRRLARLRRLLAPHRELYGRLATPDFELLSNSSSPVDFDALHQRFDQALQVLETTREMIVSSFEIYTTWTAHGTNRVMKLLTVVSVTLLPPTLLASVMGMNSLPPLLVSGPAFLVTLSVMIVLVGTVLAGARWRGWF